MLTDKEIKEGFVKQISRHQHGEVEFGKLFCEIGEETSNAAMGFYTGAHFAESRYMEENYRLREALEYMRKYAEVMHESRIVQIVDTALNKE